MHWSVLAWSYSSCRECSTRRAGINNSCNPQRKWTNSPSTSSLSSPTASIFTKHFRQCCSTTATVTSSATSSLPSSSCMRYRAAGDGASWPAWLLGLLPTAWPSLPCQDLWWVSVESYAAVWAFSWLPWSCIAVTLRPRTALNFTWCSSSASLWCSWWLGSQTQLWCTSLRSSLDCSSDWRFIQEWRSSISTKTWINYSRYLVLAF